MADNKKMSVADMLAAARAEKLGGAATPSPPTAPSPQAEQTEPSAAAVPPASKPAATKGMSIADMLAAARGEKTGESKPAAAKAVPKEAAAKPAAVI